jgi:hypothetical protein
MTLAPRNRLGGGAALFAGGGAASEINKDRRVSIDGYCNVIDALNSPQAP